MGSLSCDTVEGIASVGPCIIGINGFGRIGRNALRAALSHDNVRIAAINHTCASADDLVYLIRNDTALRDTKTPLRVDCLSSNAIAVNGQHIMLTSERDLKNLNWAGTGVDYVLECTGKFTTRETAQVHVTHGGAKRVLISAPSSDSPEFVYGVNSERYQSTEECRVISNASCTTNCVTPILQVLSETVGIEQAFLTTVHAATRSQQVLDGYNKKNRRLGRGVFNNIIPTETGAAKAVAAVLPALKGKVTGISIRVPISNVSLVDLTVNTSEPTSLGAILDVFRKAADSQLAGILTVAEEELVSSDYIGSSYSAVIDAPGCVELNSQFFKILAWYDNEWGYSNRLLDLVTLVHAKDCGN